MRKYLKIAAYLAIINAIIVVPSYILSLMIEPDSISISTPWHIVGYSLLLIGTINSILIINGLRLIGIKFKLNFLKYAISVVGIFVFIEFISRSYVQFFIYPDNFYISPINAIIILSSLTLIKLLYAASVFQLRNILPLISTIIGFLLIGDSLLSFLFNPLFPLIPLIRLSYYVLFASLFFIISNKIKE